MSSTFIHVVARIRISFLMLNNILLYVHTTFCLFFHPLLNIWVASTVIVSNTAMNTDKQTSLLFSIWGSICSEYNHGIIKGNSIFDFLGISYCFTAAVFHLLTNSVQGFQFCPRPFFCLFIIIKNIVNKEDTYNRKIGEKLLVLDSSHFNGYKVISHCSFALHFCDD